MKKEGKVIKNTPTVLAAGMRVGDNSGIFILEFIEENEDGNINVLSSTALTDNLKKRLHNILTKELSDKKTDV